MALVSPSLSLACLLSQLKPADLSLQAQPSRLGIQEQDQIQAGGGGGRYRDSWASLLTHTAMPLDPIRLRITCDPAMVLWATADTTTCPYLSVLENKIPSHSLCLEILEISGNLPNMPALLQFPSDRGSALLLQGMESALLSAGHAHRQLCQRLCTRSRGHLG